MHHVLDIFVESLHHVIGRFKCGKIRVSAGLIGLFDIHYHTFKMNYYKKKKKLK